MMELHKISRRSFLEATATQRALLPSSRTHYRAARITASGR